MNFTYGERRLIQGALAISLLLHLALFAVLRLPLAWTTDPDVPLDLRLWIQSPGEREIDSAERADVLRPTAPPDARGPRPEQLVAADREEAPELPPEPAPPVATRSDVTTQGPPVDVMVSHPTDQPVSLDVVATVGSSPVAVPQRPEVPAPDVNRISMATTERSMLAARVENWSRSFQANGTSQPQLAWQENGRHYSARLERQPAAGNMDFERVNVVVTTEDEGERRETRMQMKRLAFSHFTQLVDQWDAGVQLHDDEILGRFHSNSEILLGWDRKVAPRFHGKVTTSRGYRVVSESHWRRPGEIFPGGIETRAQRVELPRFSHSADREGAADNPQPRIFTRDTQVTFYRDGTYGWRATDPGEPEQRQAIGQQPLYLLSANGAALHVSGTVRGTVLIYSPHRIVISGDLTYADNVRTMPESSHYLGLVSDGNVEIANSEVTGPGDLEVDAAIYARRRFEIRDLTGGRNDRLTILGSLSAGSISASEPRYGFKVEFDRRFERLRPPGFPQTNRYELETWDGQWAPAPSSLRLDARR